MLSRVFLQYSDDDLHRRFKASRQDFYKKALPLITFLLLALAVAIEVLYRVLRVTDLGELQLVTSAINWAYFGLFLLLSCLIRRWAWPSWLVCPLLTLIVFYYFAFVDFQRSAAVLYFT
jgi:hypothetical protein